MSTRTVTIQPFKKPNGSFTRTRIKFELVNIRTKPIIGYTAIDGGIIDPIEISIPLEGTEVKLVPQSEIDRESFYKITVKGSYTKDIYYVAVPSDTLPIEFDDLIKLHVNLTNNNINSTPVVQVTSVDQLTESPTRVFVTPEQRDLIDSSHVDYSSQIDTLTNSTNTLTSNLSTTNINLNNHINNSSTVHGESLLATTLKQINTTADYRSALGITVSGVSPTVSWGNITGTLTTQTDLVSYVTSRIPTFSTVATSGSYNDLINKPTYSIVATSGSYVDLTNKPVLSTVSSSGSYNDLINKPVLSTVATSGSYNDLINKPSVVTTTQLNTAVASAVTDSLSAFSIDDLNIAKTNSYNIFKTQQKFDSPVELTSGAKIGDLSSVIKTIKIIGTVPSTEGSNLTLNPNIGLSSIISYSVLITTQSNTIILPNDTSTGNQYSILINDLGCKITLHSTNSENLLNGIATIFVVYGG